MSVSLYWPASEWAFYFLTSKLNLTRGATDMIDKATLEIRQDDEKTVYKNLEDIGEDLPDNSPRFVLLSYPLTLVSWVPK
jgi:hypothetical protein